MEFPERLKHYRLIKGYTQKDLSELIHVKSATISSWEVGRNYPQAPKLRALAEALGVEVRELTGGLSERFSNDESTETTVSYKKTNSDIDEITSGINEDQQHKLQLDNDVDKALQAVISYDGRPVTEHDRRVLSDIIKAYLNDRK